MLALQIIGDIVLCVICLALLAYTGIDHEKKAKRAARYDRARVAEREQRKPILDMWEAELQTHAAQNSAVTYLIEKGV